jgi:hypothetical protein
MEILIIYLIGWLILSIGNYIYNIYIIKEYVEYKKLCLWRSFWTGIFSWGGVLVIIVFLLVGKIFAINEWIENKLK